MSYWIIPHAHQCGGLDNMCLQINNYPAGIITKLYFRKRSEHASTSILPGLLFTVNSPSPNILIYLKYINMQHVIILINTCQEEASYLKTLTYDSNWILPSNTQTHEPHLNISYVIYFYLHIKIENIFMHCWPRRIVHNVFPHSFNFKFPYLGVL